MDRDARIQIRKKRYFVAILLALVLLFFFLHRQITQGVFSTLIEGTVYRVETEEKAVAFTFEVVWGPGQTEEILDILDRYQVHATFFISGSWLRKYSDLAREIIIRGHEIGQHGYEHKLLTEMTDEELKIDFEQTWEALQEELKMGTILFRPPFGELDQRVFDYAQEHGLTTVLWSINAQDWMGLMYTDMKNSVIEKLHKGAIILMHTHSSQTIKALPIIIQSLRAQEYDILTFSELQKRGIH